MAILRVGLIGAGVMGADHALNLSRRVSRAELIAVSDPDGARLAKVSDDAGARYTTADPRALIEHPEVDAVLVASPDHTHADLVLACLEAGKPILCEKPLAPRPEECLRVVAAEVAAGRRLVQVGFMRRFDPAYRAMKQKLAEGQVGEPLFLHCAHRNAAAPPWFESGMLITNSAVHDLDIARWMLDDEFVSAHVFAPRPGESGALRDPQMIVAQTSAGILVDIEVYLNAEYGYDVRAEAVCRKGTVALAPPVHVYSRQAGQEAFSFAADWRPRFAAAYQHQLQAWVDSIHDGSSVGASAWDGYVATAVATTCLESLATGRSVGIALEQRPALYA